MCAKNVVLLTGGLGYIGSHISVQLQQHYPLYKIVIIDNLVNTKEDVRDNIEQVTGKPVEFHRVDLTNYDALLETMQNYHDKIHCVIHLAGRDKLQTDSYHKALSYIDSFFVVRKKIKA
jgi:UDP-glucose 4-epimerase